MHSGEASGCGTNTQINGDSVVNGYWKFNSFLTNVSKPLQRDGGLARVSLQFKVGICSSGGGSAPSTSEVMPQPGGHAAPNRHQRRYIFSRHPGE